MMKRTVYKVIHASPEENQKGSFHYITCYEKQTAETVAKDLRKERGNDEHIALELHHEFKRPNENEWGWQIDWENYGDKAIEHIDYY